DTYASGHHARIFAAEGRRWVEDLGSTNGTLVGGIRINGSAALDPGVVIQVGETTMELQV
ncbi:FHA domain-containing protein, partial [Escherichia coli]|nr:FHA domain-containing protein [Escherichia coli]